MAWRVEQPLPLLAFCWAAILGVALAFVDDSVHRLPDRLVFAALAGALPALIVAAIAEREPERLLTASACAVATAAFYLLLALLPHGYGLGDVKLGLLVGLVAGWYGPRAALAATLIAILLAGLAAAIVAVPTHLHRLALAHGPFMLVGALAAILLRGS